MAAKNQFYVLCLRFKDRQDYRVQLDVFCKDRYENCEI